MATEVLSQRAVNRATLERQLLLTRSSIAPAEAVAHLVGLQAQKPLDPYLALWSRLEGFDPKSVATLLEERSLVRIVVMRGTIHLVTADDALVLRPLTQSVLDAEIRRHSEFASHLVSVDMKPIVAYAHDRLREQPLTGTQLRATLAERFPQCHAAALSYACRCLLPLVQVPPRGMWGRTGQVTSTPLDAWVGRPLASTPSIDDVILRYLTAFGPATPADAATWSRLTGMREIFDRLRPRLRTFQDERGRELFDRPDAPRPPPDTPAPVRFLPEYDNVLLSHDDRSRFGSDDDHRFSRATGPYQGAVLVNGEVHAIWHVEHDKKAKRSTLVVEHDRLDRGNLTAVEAEAAKVADFWLGDRPNRDVRLRQISPS